MNPRGFFENQRLRLLNDRILEALGAAWDDPFALQNGWERRPELEHLREEAREALRSEFHPGRLIVIKDPRLCVLLPLWQPLFAQAGLDPGYVLVVRHPFEAADSLAAGYGFPREKGILLWMRHMLAAEAFSRERRRVFVRFNDLLSRPQQFQARVASGLGIEFPRSWDQAQGQIGEFLEPGLKHHDHDDLRDAPAAMAPALEYHAILRRLAEGADELTSAAEMDAVDAIRNRFYQDLDLYYHPEILARVARGRVAGDIQKRLEEREAGIRDQAVTIRELEAHRHAWRRQADRCVKTVEELALALERTGDELARARGELTRVTESKAWRLAEVYRRWVYGVLQRRR